MSDIKAGDFVIIQGQSAVAEVLSVKGNELEVALGPMKMTVKKNKVSLTGKPQEDKKEPEKIQSAFVDTKEKLMHFQFELDVRGKMKDEVITELTSWTDDAILLGIKEAKIVHGRGNGILKDTVRSFLKKYKEVESVGDDPIGRSGDFVTVVKFRN